MIEITKSAGRYEFNRIDEDGEKYSLGSATERVQDEGTPDEMRWFDGQFDTQPISFEDDDELVRVIERRKPNDRGEVFFA